MPFKTLGRPFLSEGVDIESMTELERFKFLHKGLMDLEAEIKSVKTLLEDEIVRQNNLIWKDLAIYQNRLDSYNDCINKIEKRLDKLEDAIVRKVVEKKVDEFFPQTIGHSPQITEDPLGPVISKVANGFIASERIHNLANEKIITKPEPPDHIVRTGDVVLFKSERKDGVPISETEEYLITWIRQDTFSLVSLKTGICYEPIDHPYSGYHYDIDIPIREFPIADGWIFTRVIKRGTNW